MNRIDRLTSMILMLQSHRVVTADQIATHFEISARTVYRDISALGEAGVPIVAEAGVGYSLMRGYNVPPIMFTQEEIAALFMSGEITEQFGDESLKKSLAGALLKVRSALPDGHKNYLSELGDRVEVWRRPTGFRDGSTLMPIQEAVVKRRCIEATYDSGGRGVISERTLEPLGLTFYGQQWHLIAWCRLREEVRDFRLDRLRSWTVLDECFSGHDDFSLEDFLNAHVKDGPRIPLTLECEEWALDRVLHDSPCKVLSQERAGDGRWLIEAQSFALEWMARWVVGMGDAITVRGPQELKELIAEAAERIVERYRK